VEYAALAALISIAAVGLMALIGIEVQGFFQACLNVLS
jgi:Flp pilus assembly pilin Flp